MPSIVQAHRAERTERGIRHRAQSCVSSDRQAARAALRAEFERQQNMPAPAVDDAAIMIETVRLERKTLQGAYALCERIRDSVSGGDKRSVHGCSAFNPNNAKRGQFPARNSADTSALLHKRD